VGARWGQEGGGVASCFEAGGDEVYYVTVLGVDLLGYQYYLSFSCISRITQYEKLGFSEIVL
jgi:uncharacterized ParB-like nuclease family protein